MRHRLLLFAILGLIAVATLLPSSEASFTSSSTSNVRVGTDSVGNWLHLYSQSTDPAGLTGYWLRAGSTSPAAVGIDATLSVDLGQYASGGSQVQCSRVFTIQSASSFPTGTTITVTATLLPDPTTGTQPITAVGLRTVGQNNTTPSSVTLGTGVKRQANLRITLPVAKGVYRPKVVITVTYTGMTTAYYQYTVPVQVTVGSQAGMAALEGTMAPASGPAEANATGLTTVSTTVVTDGFAVPGVDPPAEATETFATPGSEWLPAPDEPVYDPTAF
jgi:hypothetical protein